MKKLQQFTLAMLVLALPIATQAQSLADVARTEEARRKAVGKPAKVYTNDSLKRDFTESVPSNATPAAPAAEQQAQAPAPDAAAGGEGEQKKDQKYWSARINAARQALERSRMFADALQSRINGLNADFTNRDDPAQRAQIDLERQRSLSEFERVKKEIADQTKAIAAIEEEARKAGVPAGWLR